MFPHCGKISVIAGLICLGFTLGGCQSTPDTADMRPVVVIPFEPVSPTSTIHWGSGRYSDVFDASSFAVWVDEGVSDMKKMDAMESGETLDDDALAGAVATHSRYHVLEVHLESRFGDAAAAFDAVGLRNTDVYMQAPGGNKIYPVQRIPGAPAKETQVEALRQYSRSNVLLFPKTDVQGAPLLTTEDRGVRLFLAAFNTEYYFEWPGVPAPPVDPNAEATSEPGRFDAMKKELSEKETYQVLSMRFSELYGRLKSGLTRGGGETP